MIYDSGIANMIELELSALTEPDEPEIPSDPISFKELLEIELSIFDNSKKDRIR